MKTAQRTLLPAGAVALGAVLVLAAACSTDSPTAPRQTPAPGNPITGSDIAPVVAAFTCVGDAGTLQVVCRDESTGDPTSWLWDFGDGTTSRVQHPLHDYDEEGLFVVTLQVFDSISSDTLSQFVEVGEPAGLLVAAFSFSPANPVVGQPVAFLDESTGTPPPSSFSWRFGDGRPGSTLQHPTHTYFKTGTFVVELTVSNDQVSDSAADFITVGPAEEPIAGFTFEASGLTVIFTNTSTGADTFRWEFGDGDTSNLENPIHTYGAAGVFSVTLVATNDFGSDTVSQFVEVPPP